MAHYYCHSETENKNMFIFILDIFNEQKLQTWIRKLTLTFDLTWCVIYFPPVVVA